MTSVADKKIGVYDVPTIRTIIVSFSVHLGRLFCAVEGYAHGSTVQTMLMELLYHMYQISCLLDIHLEHIIIRKAHLNKFQFTKDMSDEFLEDYDKFLALAEIAENFNQSQTDAAKQDTRSTYEQNIHFMSRIPYIYSYLKECTKEQGWFDVHTTRNLIMALIAETGQLAQQLEWTGDHKIAFDKSKVDAISEELGDICIYLIYLGNTRGITWQKY